MNSFKKQQLRDLCIYYLKSLIFAVASYLLILVIYGGARLSIFAWIGTVFLPPRLATSLTWLNWQEETKSTREGATPAPTGLGDIGSR